MMGKLIEITHVSLGGQISPLDWAFPYLDDEHERYVTEMLARADALLLGRRTYQGFGCLHGHGVTAVRGPDELDPQVRGIPAQSRCSSRAATCDRPGSELPAHIASSRIRRVRPGASDSRASTSYSKWLIPDSRRSCASSGPQPQEGFSVTDVYTRELHVTGLASVFTDGT